MPVNTQRYYDTLAQIKSLEHEYKRSANSVQLIAVSKAQPLTKIQALYDAGQRDFGESYLTEALNKISALNKKNIVWHFIGRIQSNKCADIARNFSWVHSVFRLKEAQLLNQYREGLQAPLNICIQVNIDHGANKGGVMPSEALAFAQEVSKFEHLKLRGLMAIPEPSEAIAEQRKPYQHLMQLFKQLNDHGLNLDTLSMGMSQDYAAAIMEGATMVRIGQSIFGPREKKESYS